MMLHDREPTMKILIIEKLRNYVKEYQEILKNDTIYFQDKVDKYSGVKLHHGYVFLFESPTQLTYPRGIHGKILVNILNKLKEKKVYSINQNEGLTYKVKLK
jgi:hypothetical protein